MSTALESEIRTWVDSSAAARAVGVSRALIRRWGLEGLVGVRRLPYCRTTYRLRDVKRLVEAHTTPPSEPE
jgi:predicted site-specific integrase-resolvase